MQVKRKLAYLPLFTVMLTVLSASGSRADDNDIAKLPRFEPTACQHDLVEGSTTQCGFLVVPENRKNANSNTIKIHLTIFKSNNNDTKYKPLLYLTGGPGAETAFAIKVFENAETDPRVDFFRAGFGGNRDLIVVDQRGTNRSLPSLYCSQELGAVRTEVYGMSFREAANQRVPLLRQCHTRLVSEGIDLSGYNSVENAKDIRDLVKALGLGQVNLYCVSYGTRLCLFIMRQSPEIIRSVVLDSVLPPEINPFEDEVGGTLYALDAFYKAAAAQYPHLQNRVEQIMTRLQANPVHVVTPLTPLNTFYAAMETRFPRVINSLLADPAHAVSLRKAVGSVTVSVTGVKFASYVVNRLRETPYAAALPQEVDRMFKDEDYLSVAKGWVTNVNFFWPADGPGFQDPSLGMYNSVFAANDTAFTTADKIRQIVDNEIQHEALAEWYLTNFIYMEPGVQHLWKVDPLPASVRDPVASDLPALMLVGGLDPATPPIFSQESAKRLPNAFYFIIRAGHATAFLECVVEMLHAFLLDPATAPSNGCPPAYTWD